ncbi:hypothetical protein [Moraxella sp. ZY210820]|uniref:hypothetical protein n=1 Tax=unclassified Moraxella TaxID=2685852 RepID=UPI0027311534|nr:hypothetical protein [Moraxella sp. ZY210820]WLF83796.1 hypothetical protein LU301_11210 [Moraxella sp. ZY210820]
MTQYTVIQQHFGDKQYFENDVRIVENEQDAEQLINMGLIKPLDEQQANDDKKPDGEKTSDDKKPEDEKPSTKKTAKKGDE